MLQYTVSVCTKIISLWMQSGLPTVAHVLVYVFVIIILFIAVANLQRCIEFLWLYSIILFLFPKTKYNNCEVPAMSSRKLCWIDPPTFQLVAVLC